MSKPRRKYKKHNKTKNIILIVVGFLIVTTIILAITFIARKNQATSEGTVPLYTGTSIYRYISFASHKHFVYQLLNYTNCINNTCIVMFGLTTCSHCHAMYEFFMNDEAYSHLCRIFWIDGAGGREVELFSNLVDIEMLSGVDPRIAGAVPQTVVVRNGSIEAIVVGEVRSRDFWNKLVGLS